MAETIIVELGTKHFQEANAAVRAALAEADTVCIVEAYAQRYLGCTLPAGKRLEIHGTPGNDLACYMDGGEVEVFGSAQDQTANTMNAGTVVVHGRVGDAAGYAMRGGELIVRDGCGWRGGINMKQYGGKCPVIVIGGDAGDFLGEYMAGGIIVLGGEAGDYLGSGMHGGVIYLRYPLADERIASGLIQEPIDEGDRIVLEDLLSVYDGAFAGESPPLGADLDGWYRLRSASSRPYGTLYAR